MTKTLKYICRDTFKTIENGIEREPFELELCLYIEKARDKYFTNPTHPTFMEALKEGIRI